MTRKEELEERVEKIASRFERTGESQAKYEIVEALLQVEREVWSRISARMAMIVESKDALHEWVRAQQQELT